MAIDVRQLQTRPLDPLIADELDIYERTLAEYLDGGIDEDVFRVFRLNHGVYGQRQGGRNQMVRVKIPYGQVTPEQLETLGYIAETYSRGWGHLTTRQNVQFHFVQLEQTPEVLRILASVGLTTREACGDTVRNVVGCHLAGACPFEKLDITPWAEATARLFLRHGYAQRLPRKFKINFSGCATDCGQAMFNDVGVVAVTRERADGTTEPGFKVFVAGGLGANPHPAQALEDFTAREDLLPTIEACLRTFDHYGNRDNKIRARMKWLVDTMGIEELRERIVKERKFLRAARYWPGGIPEQVQLRGRRAGRRHTPGHGRRLRPERNAGAVAQVGSVRTVGRGERRARHRPRHRLLVRLRPARRHHDRAVPSPRRHPARLRSSTSASRTGRTSYCATSPKPTSAASTTGSRRSGWPSPAPSSRATSSRARAPTPATSRSPSRAAWRPPSATRSKTRGSPKSVACASTSRAARTAAASTTSPTSGSWAWNAVRTAGPRPATRCCSAATSARWRSSSAPRRASSRPRPRRKPSSRSSVASPRSAMRARRSRPGSHARAAPRMSATPSRSSTISRRPDIAPDFYVDYDETGPYVAEVGDGECAAT